MSWLQRVFGTKPSVMTIEEVDSLIADAIADGLPLSIPDRIQMKQQLVDEGLIKDSTKIQAGHTGYRGAVRANMMTINETRSAAGLGPIDGGDDIPYIGTREEAMETAVVIRNKRLLKVNKRTIVIKRSCDGLER